MKEVLMTQKEIFEEIEMEAQCGINDLLQNLLSSPQDRAVDVFWIINDKDIKENWVIRDKETGEDIHL